MRNRFAFLRAVNVLFDPLIRFQRQHSKIYLVAIFAILLLAAQISVSIGSPRLSAFQTNSSSASTNSELTQSTLSNSTPPLVTPNSPGFFLSPNGILVRNIHLLPGGDPIGSGNQLFNITSANSYVYTEVNPVLYNEVFGGSCTVSAPAVSSPPCNPTDGSFSYQFNVEFPTFNNSQGFFFQSVVEFDLNSTGNNCHANNGGNSYYFSCGLANSYGDYFEWTISSSGGYFVSTSFILNGQTDYTAGSQQIFGCTSCAKMLDAYAQSVWVGWGSTDTLNGIYANFYEGQGLMEYSGMSPYSCTSNCVNSEVVTAETSNMQYTTPTLSNGIYSQNFLAGTVASTYVASGTYGSGTVSNPGDVLGVPDGYSANIHGPNYGDGGYIKAEFQVTSTGYTSYSGFIVVDGYSYSNGGGAYYSHVYVDVSSDGSTYQQVYAATWNPSSTNKPTWINIASVSNAKYVEIIAKDDNGYSANVYVDSISLYIGSYVQTYIASGTNGSGTVTNPSGIVGVPDNSLARIYGGNPGDGGWVEGEFSALLSGWLTIDGYSYNNNNGGYYSHVYVYTSSDGTNWQQQYVGTWGPSANNVATWVIKVGVSNIQYVKIEAIDDNGYSANVYIDAVYVT